MFIDFKALISRLKEPTQPIRVQDNSFHSYDETELEPAEDLQKYDDSDGLVFDIEYKDSKGNITHRSVECYGFQDHKNSQVMQAHCYVRERLRTFRIDRIISANNSYTGEVYDDLETWLTQLRLYFNIKTPIKNTITRKVDPLEILMARAEDGLRILFYFARCDDDYHPNESQVIAEYIDNMAFLPSDDKPLDYDFDNIMMWAENLRVKRADALKAIDRLDQKGELENMIRVIKKVIDADGILHPKEHDAYLELLGKN